MSGSPPREGRRVVNGETVANETNKGIGGREENFEDVLHRVHICSDDE